MGPSLPAKRALYLSLRPATFKKWYSLNQPIIFAMKWLQMSSIVSSVSSSEEQGWKKRQAVSNSLLHSLPLQQKWMQTLSGKSQGKISLILIVGLCNQQGKISLILIVGLCNQNMPMSNCACFMVLLITTPCFFSWRWTGNDLDPPLGVVVLHLSPAEVRSVGSCWWVELVPKLLA